MKKPYFEGWYFKHVTKKQVIAFIASFHTTLDQERYGCIQMITKDNSYLKKYSWEEVRGETIEEGITIGNNLFSLDGIKLDIDFGEQRIKCNLNYSEMIKIDTPIMGPFQRLKFMECSHEIYSLIHQVSGTIKINEVEDNVVNGLGYIEGDRGTSFPSSYLWTQCNFGNNSIVLAVGKVSLLGIRFHGIIGHIYYNGIHYRLATYNGAKVIRRYPNFIRIKQKQYKLVVHLLKRNENVLQAPMKGDMMRAIHESVTCSVRYRFYIGGEKIFDFVEETASFECDIADYK